MKSRCVIVSNMHSFVSIARSPCRKACSEVFDHGDVFALSEM